MQPLGSNDDNIASIDGPLPPMPVVEKQVMSVVLKLIQVS